MTVYRRFLRDRRRATGWWVVGVVALVLFTVAFWPTVRGQASFDELVRELPDTMRAMIGIDEAVSISSAPGYLHGRVFATLLPVLLIINAIGVGAAAIGGSESDGTLELVLGNPLSRRRLYGERALGFATLAAVPAVAACVAIVVLGAPVGLLEGVSVASVAGATLAAFALAAVFGVLAFAVGAATGRRSVAVATSSGAAVAAYLLQGVLSAAKAPEAVLNLSPWHWYLERNILVGGVSVTAIAAPVVVGAIAIAVALLVFARRDLT